MSQSKVEVMRGKPKWQRVMDEVEGGEVVRGDVKEEERGEVDQ